MWRVACRCGVHLRCLRLDDVVQRHVLSQPLTIHPTPYTLHPSPYTLHPTPYTLHPTPYTLHPTPYTLHPAPRTLHPTPLPLSLHSSYACGARSAKSCRGSSFTRKRTPLGSYRRPMPRVLGGSQGGARCFYGRGTLEGVRDAKCK